MLCSEASDTGCTRQKNRLCSLQGMQDAAEKPTTSVFPSRKLAYDADGTSLSDTELVNTLPSLRKFYPYMKEADSASLQQAVRHLNTAYRNFFSGTSGYPVFRKRKSSLSYTTPMNGNSIKVGSKSITLPKAGTIKAVIHRSITGRILSATVRRNACGQWFCSVLYDIPDKPVSCTINTGNTVGLDYKSDGLYVSSGNEICGSPKFYRVMERKLARAERRLSKKQGFAEAKRSRITSGSRGSVLPGFIRRSVISALTSCIRNR